MQLLGLFLLLSLFAGDAWPKTSPAVAVIELFASEGCSSCPPADDLLREITNRARQQGEPIYTLSFEVDYWDDLGWKDPFSSAEFTGRQQEYARVLNSSLYTPQMVINGFVAFVGSDARKAHQAIDQALRDPVTVALDISLKAQNKSSVEVVYRASGAISTARLQVALVERGLISHVKNGENAGRTLQHDNVVRYFTSLVPTAAGSISVDITRAENLKNCSIIVFAQDNKSYKILGATSIDL
jgi:hypothetical protein